MELISLIKMKFEKKYGFSKKPYSLLQGLEILAEVDADFTERGQNETVFIELFDTKDKNFGYKGYFELGLKNGDSFLEWLEIKLTTDFPENFGEIEEMIERLSDEIAQQALSAKDPPKTQTQPRKRSRWLLCGIVVALLLGGGAGTYFLMNNPLFPTTSAVETKESFQEDLELLSPEELGEKYPSKLEDIAKHYTDQQNWGNLKIFQEAYPTVSGAFDLAFYEHDWDTVIQTDVTTLTEDKKIMLCYAYIEKNMLSEAELLANKLDSNQLHEALDYAYLRRTGKLIKEKKFEEAEDVGGRIQSDDLKKEYQDAIDSASIMEEMIALYKKQKDTKNQEMWERRMNDLGTELEERGITSETR